MVKRRRAVKSHRATSIPRPEAGTEPAPVEQIREAAQALLAEGRTEEAFEYFLAALAAVLRKNTELELLLAKLGRERVASRSERISPEQLALLLKELEQLGTAEPVLDMVGEAREDATLEQDIKDANASGRAAEDRPRKRNPGWHTHQVERQIHEVVIAEAERICGGCGREKKSIGADITRTLEFVPAHFVEHEYHLAKYACGVCKQGVSTAPAPREGDPAERRGRLGPGPCGREQVRRSYSVAPAAPHLRAQRRGDSGLYARGLGGRRRGSRHAARRCAEHTHAQGIRGAHGRNGSQGARSEQFREHRAWYHVVLRG